MQIIYVAFCMISLILYAALGLPPQEEGFKIDQKVVAAHMAAWHKAAIRRCNSVSCSGVVDPMTYMLPSMKNAPAFSTSRFATRYDPGTKVLMTSVNANEPARSGISFEAMMSGLNDGVDGESSMIGVFEKATGRVNLTALTGIYKTKYITVPPAIAVAIPDGSPVITTNL